MRASPNPASPDHAMCTWLEGTGIARAGSNERRLPKVRGSAASSQRRVPHSHRIAVDLHRVVRIHRVPAGETHCHRHARARRTLEDQRVTTPQAGDGEPQAAELVELVRVRTSQIEDQIGLVTCKDLRQMLLEEGQILGIPGVRSSKPISKSLGGFRAG